MLRDASKNPNSTFTANEYINLIKKVKSVPVEFDGKDYQKFIDSSEMPQEYKKNMSFFI